MTDLFDLVPWETAELRPFSSQAEMRGALARERGRSNRTGEPFALLMLHCDPAVPLNGEVHALASDLAHRLRCTDEFGWMGANRIGVLLPHTDGGRAAQVLQTLLSSGSPQPPGEWQVYSYEPSAPRRQLQEVGHRVSASTSPARPLQTVFIRPLPLWKRLIDIVGATIGLVLSAPILLGAMALIKTVSPGPVIFRQDRAGIGGTRFTIYKLRTMTLDAEQRQAELLGRNELEGPVFKITRDPRLIPFGRFLRSTSIDELPQFWNVLTGDMSLVGPRPLAYNESEGCLPWQRVRLDVTPGMTGLWQVSGRSNVGFEPWVRMDLQYARTRSPLNDLALLARTIPAVLLRRGSR